MATGLCSEHLEFCKLTLVGWFNSCFLCLRRFLSYHTPRVLLVTLNSHYFYLSDYPKYYWYNRIPKRRQPVHYTNRVPASVRKGRKGVARSRARRAHACFRAWWPWIPACLQSPTSPRGDSRQLTDVNLATVCAAPARGPCSRLTVTTHNCGGRGVIHSPSCDAPLSLAKCFLDRLHVFQDFKRCIRLSLQIEWKRCISFVDILKQRRNNAIVRNTFTPLSARFPFQRVLVMGVPSIALATE